MLEKERGQHPKFFLLGWLRELVFSVFGHSITSSFLSSGKGDFLLYNIIFSRILDPSSLLMLVDIILFSRIFVPQPLRPFIKH